MATLNREEKLKKLAARSARRREALAEAARRGVAEYRSIVSGKSKPPVGSKGK